jgi:hypothetical protein
VRDVESTFTVGSDQWLNRVDFAEPVFQKHRLDAYSPIKRYITEVLL